MKKQLIVINGTMGVGKTTTCRSLKKILTPSVFLDGDRCWDMEPFVVSDENKAMVMENIAFLLRNFLQNSSLQYILFGWVIHQWEILDDLLNRLADLPFDCRVFTLVCTPEALQARLQRDVEQGLRTADVIPRSLQRLPLYGQMESEKVDVSRVSAREAAEEIAWQIAARP